MIEENKLNANEISGEVDETEVEEKQEQDIHRVVDSGESISVSLPDGISISLTSHKFNVSELADMLTNLYKIINGKAFLGLRENKEKEKDNNENENGNYLG